MRDDQKLIVILGPTASGKSKLAVQIARKFGGEIISADSRQVYRGMDIGTAKITKKEMSGIPHYLLDVANPKHRFSVAQYKKLALKAIKKIINKGKTPILCGGTGFYIQAVVDNILIPAVKPDFKLRALLEKKATNELFAKLEKRDPDRAINIDRFNRRRLIRALEIIYKTGGPVPTIDKIPPTLPFPKGGTPSFLKEGWAKSPEGASPLFGGGFNTLFLGVKKSKEQIAKSIHQRIINRLGQGMIQEVARLKKSGLSWRRLEEFGLEYRWIARYLQKKISLDQMIQLLQKDSEHFAKRQMTWFKKDKRIHWIQTKNDTQKIIKKFLKNSK